MTGEPVHTIWNGRMAPDIPYNYFASRFAPRLSIKWSVITLCFQPCSACYTAWQILQTLLQSLQLLQKIWTIFVINVTSTETEETYMLANHCESTPDTIGGKWWDAKDKSMMCALYILQYAKRHLSGWTNTQQWKIKSVALVVFELRASDTQSNTKSLKLN